ncbi:carboxylesterase family protein [Herbaspirillum huttiense]|uniref:carboxylesterase/lipase family protein n=1 Tax=Herbaspirillum huttiense TaxID=863372 RepID=UPI0014170D6E|nr:carboxylesterase family protein [Herbaspirillum huttiense]
MTAWGACALLTARAGKAQELAQTRRAVTVEAPAGAVRGAVDGTVRVFKGIPYALPPVGPLRFRPPQPHPGFQQTHNAFAFGPAPMQPERIQAGTGLNFLGDARQSEDCLYLNIWAPDTPGPHPVFVWIYGGSNIYGATSQPIYDGTQFAKDGVVCVTIGYRVGALGFLELGELLGEDYRGCGNNALRDQVLALQWVQKNIAAFGGDPQRITLGGESAGGKNVSTLLTLPAARGLFQQAIIESGGALTTHALSEAHKVAQLFAQQIQPHASAEELRRQLLALPADQLIKAQIATTNAYTRNFAFRTVIDGSYVPRSPQQSLALGEARHLRLLIGSNHDEALIFFRPELLEAYRRGDPDTAPIAAHEMAQLDEASIEAMSQRYRVAFPQQHPFLHRVQLLTAEEYWIPMVRLAEAHARSGGESYMYRYDQASAEAPFEGFAVHASELPMVWMNFHEPFLSMLYRETPELTRFARVVHESWIAFMREGKPVHPALPIWPRFQLNQRPTMILAAGEERIQNDPAGDQRHLWEGVL